MNWIVKTLVGAVIAGVGLKIGSDVYESAKKTLQQVAGKTPDSPEEADEAREDDLEAVLETDVVNIEREVSR